MQIKRFEARNMTEALRLIKKEFGPEAVILSARNLRREKGAMKGLQDATIEVTAAIDKTGEISFDSNGDSKQAGQFTSQPVPPTSLAPKGNLLSAYIGDGAVSAEASKKSILESIQSGIKAFSGLGSSRKPDENQPAKQTRELIDTFHGKMIEQGVEENTVFELEDMLQRSVNPDLRWGTDLCHAHILQTFMEAGLSFQPMNEDDGVRRIYGFVGPSGVGKTLTIVKLAAVYRHVLNENVALITLDSQRIGASAPLQIHAKILDVPFHAVSTGKALCEKLDAISEDTVVFVDTPGVGFNDEIRLNDLNEAIGIAGINRLFLVLSASAKTGDMKEFSRKFRLFPIKRLIFTKLDETKTYGCILNLLMHTKIPVSFLTSGQGILDSIEPASLKRILGLLLNIEEEKDVKLPSKQTHMEETIIQNRIRPRFRTYYIANQKSDLFHHPDCKSVKRIKAENRIVFNSAGEAALKQYKPCKHCCAGSVTESSLDVSVNDNHTAHQSSKSR
ncbi:MAG: hypothetical protein AB7S77_23260 [Desulfatirhabdiaceae bacterium]